MGDARHIRTIPSLWAHVENVERELITSGRLPAELPPFGDAFADISQQIIVEKMRLAKLSEATGKVDGNEIVCSLAVIGVQLKRAYDSLGVLAMQTRGETN